MTRCISLLPFSWLYRLALYVRRIYFQSRNLARLPVPVISLGNITVGGTGKTEAVAFFCQYLKSKGWKPGILSRGYGRKSHSAPLVVADRSGIQVGVKESGDEPYLLARRLPGVVVVVGENRYQSGTYAIQKLGCNLLLLDDGFQRRDQLARDLEIVLWDAADTFSSQALLPAGRLREPLSSLPAADVIILTRADQFPTATSQAALAFYAPGKPVLLARHAPRALVALNSTGLRQAPQALGQRRVLAVAGIARPQAFVKTLETLGAQVVGQCWFNDHHWYTLSDQRKILRQARALKADVVTTAKDAVRLAWPANLDYPAWILEVEFQFISPPENLERFWERYLPLVPEKK